MADPKPPRGGKEAVVDRILATEKQTRLLSGANGTQRNQVLKDLSGRGVFIGRSEDFESWSASDLTWTEFPFGPPVTFLIDQPRVVRCQYSVLSNLGMTAYTATATLYGVMRTRLIIDGEIDVAGPVFAQNNVGTTAGTGSSAYRDVSQFQTLTLTDVITLPVGEHTIQGALTEPAMFSNEGPSSWSGGLMQAFNPALVIDVLQPA